MTLVPEVTGFEDKFEFPNNENIQFPGLNLGNPPKKAHIDYDEGKTLISDIKGKPILDTSFDPHLQQQRDNYPTEIHNPKVDNNYNNIGMNCDTGNHLFLDDKYIKQPQDQQVTASQSATMNPTKKVTNKINYYPEGQIQTRDNADYSSQQSQKQQEYKPSSYQQGVLNTNQSNSPNTSFQVMEHKANQIKYALDHSIPQEINQLTISQYEKADPIKQGYAQPILQTFEKYNINQVKQFNQHQNAVNKLDAVAIQQRLQPVNIHNALYNNKFYRTEKSGQLINNFVTHNIAGTATMQVDEQIAVKLQEQQEKQMQLEQFNIEKKNNLEYSIVPQNTVQFKIPNVEDNDNIKRLDYIHNKVKKQADQILTQDIDIQQLNNNPKSQLRSKSTNVREQLFKDQTPLIDFKTHQVKKYVVQKQDTQDFVYNQLNKFNDDYNEQEQRQIAQQLSPSLLSRVQQKQFDISPTKQVKLTKYAINKTVEYSPLRVKSKPHYKNQVVNPEFAQLQKQKSTDQQKVETTFPDYKYKAEPNINNQVAQLTKKQKIQNAQLEQYKNFNVEKNPDEQITQQGIFTKNKNKFDVDVDVQNVDINQHYQNLEQEYQLNEAKNQNIQIDLVNDYDTQSPQYQQKQKQNVMQTTNAQITQKQQQQTQPTHQTDFVRRQSQQELERSANLEFMSQQIQNVPINQQIQQNRVEQQIKLVQNISPEKYIKISPSKQQNNQNQMQQQLNSQKTTQFTQIPTNQAKYQQQFQQQGITNTNNQYNVKQHNYQETDEQQNIDTENDVPEYQTVQISNQQPKKYEPQQQNNQYKVQQRIKDDQNYEIPEYNLKVVQTMQHQAEQKLPYATVQKQKIDTDEIDELNQCNNYKQTLDDYQQLTGLQYKKKQDSSQPYEENSNLVKQLQQQSLEYQLNTTLATKNTSQNAKQSEQMQNAVKNIKQVMTKEDVRQILAQKNNIQEANQIQTHAVHAQQKDTTEQNYPINSYEINKKQPNDLNNNYETQQQFVKHIEVNDDIYTLGTVIKNPTIQTKQSDNIAQAKKLNSQQNNQQLQENDNPLQIVKNTKAQNANQIYDNEYETLQQDYVTKQAQKPSNSDIDKQQNTIVQIIQPIVDQSQDIEIQIPFSTSPNKQHLQNVDENNTFVKMQGDIPTEQDYNNQTNTYVRNKNVKIEDDDQIITNVQKQHNKQNSGDNIHYDQHGVLKHNAFPINQENQYTTEQIIHKQNQQNIQPDNNITDQYAVNKVKQQLHENEIVESHKITWNKDERQLNQNIQNDANQLFTQQQKIQKVDEIMEYETNNEFNKLIKGGSPQNQNNDNFNQVQRQNIKNQDHQSYYQTGQTVKNVNMKTNPEIQEYDQNFVQQQQIKQNSQTEYQVQQGQRKNIVQSEKQNDYHYEKSPLKNQVINKKIDQEQDDFDIMNNGQIKFKTSAQDEDSVQQIAKINGKKIKEQQEDYDYQLDIQQKKQLQHEVMDLPNQHIQQNYIQMNKGEQQINDIYRLNINKQNKDTSKAKFNQLSTKPVRQQNNLSQSNEIDENNKLQYQFNTVEQEQLIDQQILRQQKHGKQDYVIDEQYDVQKQIYLKSDNPDQFNIAQRQQNRNNELYESYSSPNVKKVKYQNTQDDELQYADEQQIYRHQEHVGQYDVQQSSASPIRKNREQPQFVEMQNANQYRYNNQENTNQYHDIVVKQEQQQQFQQSQQQVYSVQKQTQNFKSSFQSQDAIAHFEQQQYKNQTVQQQNVNQQLFQRKNQFVLLNEIKRQKIIKKGKNDSFEYDDGNRVFMNNNTLPKMQKSSYVSAIEQNIMSKKQIQTNQNQSNDYQNNILQTYGQRIVMQKEQNSDQGDSVMVQDTKFIKDNNLLKSDSMEQMILSQFQHNKKSIATEEEYEAYEHQIQQTQRQQIQNLEEFSSFLDDLSVTILPKQQKVDIYNELQDHVQTAFKQQVVNKQVDSYSSDYDVLVDVSRQVENLIKLESHSESFNQMWCQVDFQQKIKLVDQILQTNVVNQLSQHSQTDENVKQEAVSVKSPEMQSENKQVQYQSTGTNEYVQTKQKVTNQQTQVNDTSKQNIATQYTKLNSSSSKKPSDPSSSQSPSSNNFSELDNQILVQKNMNLKDENYSNYYNDPVYVQFKQKDQVQLNTVFRNDKKQQQQQINTAKPQKITNNDSDNFQTQQVRPQKQEQLDIDNRIITKTTIVQQKLADSLTDIEQILRDSQHIQKQIIQLEDPSFQQNFVQIEKLQQTKPQLEQQQNVQKKQQESQVKKQAVNVHNSFVSYSSDQKIPDKKQIKINMNEHFNNSDMSIQSPVQKIANYLVGDSSEEASLKQKESSNFSADEQLVDQYQYKRKLTESDYEVEQNNAKINRPQNQSINVQDSHKIINHRHEDSLSSPQLLIQQSRPQKQNSFGEEVELLGIKNENIPRQQIPKQEKKVSSQIQPSQVFPENFHRQQQQIPDASLIESIKQQIVQADYSQENSFSTQSPNRQIIDKDPNHVITKPSKIKRAQNDDHLITNAINNKQQDAFFQEDLTTSIQIDLVKSVENYNQPKIKKVNNSQQQIDDVQILNSSQIVKGSHNDYELPSAIDIQKEVYQFEVLNQNAKQLNKVQQNDFKQNNALLKVENLENDLFNKRVKREQLQLSSQFGDNIAKNQIQVKQQQNSFTFVEDFVEKKQQPEQQVLYNEVNDNFKFQKIKKEKPVLQVQKEVEESESYSYYSSEESDDQENIKQQFTDLTEMLRNYPFFETVYEVCDKCKTKTPVVVVESQKQEKKQEDKVQMEVSDIQIMQELIPNKRYDQVADSIIIDAVAPVQKFRKVQDQQQFEIHKNADRVKIQNINLINNAQPKQIKTKICSLPPKPNKQVNAHEITQFNVIKKPNQIQQYQEFVIDNNDIYDSGVDRLIVKKVVDFGQQAENHGVNLQSVRKGKQQQQYVPQYDDQQIDQILTVILRQPDNQKSEEESSTQDQQSDIVERDINGTQTSSAQSSQVTEAESVKSMEMSKNSVIEKLSLSSIPKQQEQQNQSAISEIQPNTQIHYSMNSSIEPGQVYPKVHGEVVNDNVVNLDRFSAGEANGSSDYGIQSVEHKENASSLEDGELDYLKALNFLGI